MSVYENIIKSAGAGFRLFFILSALPVALAFTAPIACWAVFAMSTFIPLLIASPLIALASPWAIFALAPFLSCLIVFTLNKISGNTTGFFEMVTVFYAAAIPSIALWGLSLLVPAIASTFLITAPIAAFSLPVLGILSELTAIILAGNNPERLLENKWLRTGSTAFFCERYNFLNHLCDAVLTIPIFLFSLIGGILGAIIGGVTSCFSQRPEPIDDAVNVRQIQRRLSAWFHSSSPNNSTTPRLSNNFHNQQNFWSAAKIDSQPNTLSNNFGRNQPWSI